MINTYVNQQGSELHVRFSNETRPFTIYDFVVASRCAPSGTLAGSWGQRPLGISTYKEANYDRLSIVMLAALETLDKPEFKLVPRISSEIVQALKPQT